MGQRWLVNSESTLHSLNEYCKTEIAEGRSVLFLLSEDKRSTDQNAYYHAIIREIAKQKGDESLEEIKAYTKLHFAVPILREDDQEFKQWYDEKVKGSYSYEEKLALMHILSVSSLMSKAAMSRFIDTVIQHYSEQGFAIKI